MIYNLTIYNLQLIGQFIDFSILGSLCMNCKIVK